MRPPAPVDTEEEEDWLVTYADAITLLMAFFVMLLNFSKIDIPMFEQVAAGIKDQIGATQSVTPTRLLQLNVQEVVNTAQADQAVNVGVDDEGVVIELASNAFYKPGSSIIREEAAPVLASIAQMLADSKYNEYLIEVEGHTDDDPIATTQFPSNWELSAGRAAGVARFFTQVTDMDRRRFKISGYAETRPLEPNRYSDGTPIPDNQAKNRRVILRMKKMSPADRDAIYAVPNEIPKPEPERPETTAEQPTGQPSAVGKEETVETITPQQQADDDGQ